MSAVSHQILTTSEAGEQLRVHRKQIIVMCERGVLVGAWPTLGGHWRIPLAAVDAYKAGTRPIRRLRPTLRPTG
jgi:excisionase family DNA binding protein